MTRRFFMAGLVAVGFGTGIGTSGAPALADEATRIIIDADTANEIDDLYAIVRALVAPEFQVEGLTSAHWSRSTEPNDTVHQSQALNEQILDRMGLRETITHPVGADRSMPDRETSVDSPAARHIIARAHAGGPEDKLLVVALGAPTNLASALLLDPSIGPKVVFGFIDGDFKDGAWAPGSYNWFNDNHAVRAIFESDVEYLHMPAPSVSGEMTMTKEEVEGHLKGMGGVRELLVERWESHRYSRGKDRWIMWDIALIEAVLRPDLATRADVGAPIIRDARTVEQHPENPRRVTVFTAIDVEGMRRDFWAALDAGLSRDSAP